MALNLIFVLVGTTHSGNIGAVARAMKTMGFLDLRLVDACSHLTDEALARASGAGDVLQQAKRFDSLDAAVTDCQHVIGSSARQRNLAVPLFNCRDIASDVAILGDQQVAMVFGRERSGLSNAELDRCTRLLRIPCNPQFSSLNLGSAVQVVAYECAQALATVAVTTENHVDRPASSAAMQLFFGHLQRVMLASGFLDPDNPRQLMRRLRRYFERNRPDETEVNILRGILSAVENPHPPRNSVPPIDENSQ